MLLRCVLLASVVMLTLHGALLGQSTQSDAGAPANTGQALTYFPIRIHGIIGSDFTAAKMKWLLTRAGKVKPDVIVLDLDTPGGSTHEAEEIIDLIIKVKHVRFVAYVRKALSAGAATALACEDIYVAKEATIGAAVPFFVDRRGLPIRLPEGVAEKYQSIWRAVLRKAAEHGGHAPALADAMVDPTFALTMRKENGRILLERGGQGRVIKPKGRILTLTAGEAVACGLARRIVDGLDFLGKQVRFAAQTQPADKDLPHLRENGLWGPHGPKFLHDRASQKAGDLRLKKVSLSDLQRDNAQRQWKTWVKTQEKHLSLRPVIWSLLLLNVQERSTRGGQSLAEYWARESHVKKRGVERAEEDYRDAMRARAGGGVFASSADSVRERRKRAKERLTMARQKLGRCRQAMKHARDYPFVILALSPENANACILGYVSRDSRDHLLSKDSGAMIWLSGRATSFEGVAREESVLTLVVFDKCQVGPLRRLRPLAARPLPQRAPSQEEEARKKLQLAGMYRAAGKLNKAKSILRSLVKEYPRSEGAKEAAKQLKQTEGELDSN